jgi:regulator of sigma E protease
MYYIAEVFTGRPLPDRVLEVGQHIGIALLFVLMALALYNDIIRLVNG